MEIEYEEDEEEEEEEEENADEKNAEEKEKPSMKEHRISVIVLQSIYDN